MRKPQDKQPKIGPPKPDCQACLGLGAVKFRTDDIHVYVTKLCKCRFDHQESVKKKRGRK